MYVMAGTVVLRCFNIKLISIRLSFIQELLCTVPVVLFHVYYNNYALFVCNNYYVYH